MKIGLITYCDIDGNNYGQILQGFATLKYLVNQGHDVSLLQVPYRFDNSIKTKVKAAILRILGRGKQNSDFLKWNENVIKESQLHPRYFSRFIKEHMNYREGKCSDFLLDGYDAYVSGSDQIWSWPNSLYMLGWAPNNKLKISIASSVGCGYYPLRKKIQAWRYLRHYDLITVREENGIELCRSIGIKNAYCVLDPVFLHDKDFYAQYETPVIQTSQYILLYLLPAPFDVELKDIIAFAKEQGLNVRYVESQGRNDSFIKEKEYPTIGEWLSLVKGAVYVITNSFHGTAFSIIYQKSFLALPLVGVHSNMNIRLNSLLSKMKLNDRVYAGDIGVIKKDIDWAESQSIISKNKKVVDSLVNSYLR